VRPPAWSGTPRKARESPANHQRNPGLIVRNVTLRDFRSYERLELALEPGLVLVTGANGAGKTNLLESLHVGTQGFSPRTRADQQLVRLGADGARVALAGDRDGRPLQLEVTVQQSGKRAKLNGAALRSAEQLRAEVATLVFTPDRLAVVKGGPAARRAYFDRTLGRLQPSRASVPVEYAAAVGQRNAALRRVQIGASTREAVAPWTEQVATLGAQLVEYRRDALAVLSPAFSERAGELGLSDAALDYGGEPPTVAALAARLERDLERGVTGLGPHLDDITIRSGARDLRTFGSQGEQRLAVLSLLLAEAEVIAEQRGTPPLVLLDDVLSELDGDRRRALARMIERGSQTVITATATAALPAEPAQTLAVAPGEVR
jgi:DNA replication and repair protein RecF